MWTNLTELSALSKDLTKHPNATKEHLLALQTEGISTLRATLERQDATWASLLSLSVTSSLSDGSLSPEQSQIGRPGLLLHPAIVAANSAGDHTDIPKRGRFLLRGLFCEVSPAPPPNVGSQLPPLPADSTQRERFEKIGQEPSCSGCHARLNPMGFAMERYDELGRIRVSDDFGKRLRTESIFEPQGSSPVSFANAGELFRSVSENVVAQNCFVLHAFRHAASRMERGRGDACHIRDQVASARGKEFLVQDVVLDSIVRWSLAPRAGQ